jgi:predicted hydrocarbon binding protein
VSTASELRKISRLRGTASQRRRQLADMIRWGLSPVEIYDEGQNDGQQSRARSLTDVLVGIKECGLGIASILEESSQHATFRVFQSLCCKIDGFSGPEGKKCFYLAGFIAGAITSMGGNNKVFVRELSCGDGNPGTDRAADGGDSCMLVASW